VLRALSQPPQAGEAFLNEGKRARGANAHLDRAIGDMERQLKQPGTEQSDARRFVEGLALALQAALLVQHAPAFISDAFCAARLGGTAGLAYRALATKVVSAATIARAMP